MKTHFYKKFIAATIIAILGITTINAQETKTSQTSLKYPQVQELSFGYSGEGESYNLSYSHDMHQYLNLEAAFSTPLKFSSDEVWSHLGYIAVGVQRKLLFSDNFILSFRVAPYVGMSYANIVTEEYHEAQIVKGIQRRTLRETQTPSYSKIDAYTTTDNESEFDFTYGATAEIGVGFKIFETKKGKDLFLNIGYKIFAGEFKTEGMFDNGFFKIGLMRTL